MRRNLAHWFDEVRRIFRVFDLTAHGAEGHGPVHLLLISAAEIGFAMGRGGEGLDTMLSGPVQHYQSATFEAWQLNVRAQLADRKCFRGAQFSDIPGSVQLLTSSLQRERVKMLSRYILCVWGVWNGFAEVPCRFRGEKDGDGHLFWDCTFPLIAHVREL